MLTPTKYPFYLRFPISTMSLFTYFTLLPWHFNFLPGFTYQQTLQQRTVHTPRCFHSSHIHLLLFNWHLLSFQCSHCDWHFQTFQLSGLPPPYNLLHLTQLSTLVSDLTLTFFQSFLQGSDWHFNPFECFQFSSFFFSFFCYFLQCFHPDWQLSFLRFLYFKCRFNLNLDKK